MGAFMLGLLLVVVMGLASGALLALVLREIHIRHPLPLGGTIGPRPSPKKAEASITETTEGAETIEDVEAQEKPTESIEGDTFSDSLVDNILHPFDASPVNSADAEQEKEPVSVDASVFDGTSIPENLPPVGDTLAAMTAEVSPSIPSDFENLIEESAKPESEVLSKLPLTDDFNLDDLRELEDALPGEKEKIDFSQELDTEQEFADSVPSMAKEVLGENYDFDALEQQVGMLKQSFQPPVLDVLEDETGTVQVSSPFMAHVIPQIADIAVPQTVLSTFSSDWIQELGGATEMMEGDLSQFCFTEESRPMLAKKKKNVVG